MTVHQICGLKNSIYTTGCGQEVKSKNGDKPDSVTGWWREVTCPLCAIRVIVHKKVEDMATMQRLIDDPQYTHRYFHFTGKRYKFMWLEPTPLVYIYNRQEDENAMQATHIKEHCGPLTDTPATYEMAQQAAKDWITMHSERFADDGTLKGAATVRRPPAPSKPIVPKGYTGDLCMSCGKIDEGDFMPSPNDMTKTICMTCLVKANK